MAGQTTEQENLQFILFYDEKWLHFAGMAIDRNLLELNVPFGWR